MAVNCEAGAVEDVDDEEQDVLDYLDIFPPRGPPMSDEIAALRKQVELLEKRVRHVDVEIAQARVSIDVWKDKLERERRVFSAFVERHGLRAAWQAASND